MDAIKANPRPDNAKKRESDENASRKKAGKKKKDKKEKKPKGTRRQSQKPGFMRGTDQIGPYLIMKKIGKGAMGTVYMATDKNDGKTHAIKRISLKKIPEIEREGIETEVKMLKYLTHPNIVKYVDTIRQENYLNIILEYVPNGALSSMLNKFGVFTETLTCHYISQTLDALSYLHQQGIIHRDIKGANILSDSDGVVKLTDFGVATKFRRDFSEDQQLPAGTMSFMAPEIVKMTSPPTYACDIWSLGATVIELLTGKPPYADEEGMAVAYRIVNDETPPMPLNVSAACTNFLLECFQKDPDLRISSKLLRKHDWLEFHRESKKSTIQQHKSSLMKSRLTAFEDILSPKSPKPPFTASKWYNYSMGRKVDLSKYVETEDDATFDDLEIENVEIQVQDEAKMDPQILALDISFEDETDSFKFETGDELRFRFENEFRELNPEKDASDLVEILDSLQNLSEQNPSSVSKMILDIMTPGGTGLMILMDLLGGRAVSFIVAQKVIRFINTLLRNNGKLEKTSRTFQERICVLGMISIVLRFGNKQYPMPLRTEAAEFAWIMCKSNSYTRKMFCACGGLRVLVALFDRKDSQFHEKSRTLSHPILPTAKPLALTSQSSSGSPRKGSVVDTKKERRLNEKSTTQKQNAVEEKQRKPTLIAIDCVGEIFDISDYPKDDFCRLLCEYGILPRLTRAFSEMNYACNKTYITKISNLIFTFSGADTKVRRCMAQRNVLKPVLVHLSDLPIELMEKLIKSLKMICGLKDPGALDQLEAAGIVEVLVPLLNHPKRDIYNQLLLCMEMILDVSPRRMESAVVAGLIPRLLKIATKESTMIQVVKKLICSLPMSSHKVRLELKKHCIVASYLSWLSEPSWRNHALSALSSWLKEEPRFVGQLLSGKNETKSLISLVLEPSVTERHLSTTLPTILSMIEYSPMLNLALSQVPKFVRHLVSILQSKLRDDPLQMRIHTASTQILDTLTNRAPNLAEFTKEYKITEAFQNVAEDAKQLGKVKLWRVAENCKLHIQLRLQSIQLYSSNRRQTRTIIDEDKDEEYDLARCDRASSPTSDNCSIM